MDILKKITLLLLIVNLAGCSNDTNRIYFTAKVIYIWDNAITVEPMEQYVSILSDRTSFGTTELVNIDISVGDIIVVAFDGMVLHSYPTQINALYYSLYMSQ